MTTLLLALPLLAVAAAVESAVLARLPFLSGRLDLVLLLTLAWTLSGDWVGGMIWGFVGGLWLDLLSGGPLGLSALAMVLAAYLAGLTEGRFWRSHVLLPLAVCALGTLGYHGLHLIGLSLGGHSPDWGAGLGRVTLPALALNAALMLPVYQAMRWLQTLVFPPPVRL